MKLKLKDILALIIGLSVIACLVIMLNGEANVVPGPTFNYEHYVKVVLPGLKQYAGAFGIILLAVSIAYILLGSENDIATRPDKD